MFDDIDGGKWGHREGPQCEEGGGKGGEEVDVGYLAETTITVSYRHVSTISPGKF